MKQQFFSILAKATKKKRLHNVTEFASAMTTDHSAALPGLHAYSGRDTTSAFKGRGKVKPIKSMRQNDKKVATLARLCDSWDVSEDLMKDLEEFTCSLYGRQQFKHVDDLRFFMLQERCKKDIINPNMNVDLSGLPPCSKRLKQHIRRANYQTGI